eukprot:GILK01005360.1.p1 GENE.GILK01005360.1~~GILK01005360.1.p1  ORF type:complete len:284 (-),score=59.47 GILK01005360.1:50-859(-)
MAQEPGALIPTLRETETCPNEQKDQGKKFKFFPQRDIVLLREIETLEPWAAGHGQVLKTWIKVAENVSTVFKVKITDRACQDRFKLLETWFRKNDQENLRKSGKEEEFEERQQLLTEILAAKDDWESTKDSTISTQKAKKEEEQSKAEELREAALKTLREKSSTEDGDSRSSSSKKKRKQAEAITELVLLTKEEIRTSQDRFQRQLQDAEEERAIKRRKLELKEKELSARLLELEETKKDKEIDREERRRFMELHMRLMEEKLQGSFKQ